MIAPMVLAKQCQAIRRELMNRHFGQVEDKYWCVVKSAATLLQIMNEVSGENIDELRDIRHLVDEAILIATGEDISGCSACKKDREGV